MATFFHATPSSNVDGILRKGLIPGEGRGFFAFTKGRSSSDGVFATSDISGAIDWGEGLIEEFNIPSVHILRFSTNQVPIFEDEDEVIFRGSISPQNISIAEVLE